MTLVDLCWRTSLVAMGSILGPVVLDGAAAVVSSALAPRALLVLCKKQSLLDRLDIVPGQRIPELAGARPVCVVRFHGHGQPPLACRGQRGWFGVTPDPDHRLRRGTGAWKSSRPDRISSSRS